MVADDIVLDCENLVYLEIAMIKLKEYSSN